MSLNFTPPPPPPQLAFHAVADPLSPEEGTAEVVAAETPLGPTVFVRYAPHEETHRGTVVARGEIRVLIGHGATKGQPIYLIADYTVEYLNGPASRGFAFRRAEEGAAGQAVRAWERLIRESEAAAARTTEAAS